MASDNIKVAIRVRQLIQKELASGLKSHWTVLDNSICCDETDANGRKPVPYMFDRVFDDTTITVDIFEEVCKPIVDSALAGFNGTIFAYGQSSSGKTFTMSGSRVQPGIISLAVDEIFNYIENIPDREFLIRVGYIEIYNEKVSDLLSSEDNYLKLQEDTDHNIQIVGLTEEVVKDGSGVYNVLKKGDAKRHTAETKQNDRSSRSHCILRFVIESRLAGHEDDAVNVSNLYFVDLAGSEKANDNSGDRFREGCAINKSLFTLGMVIRKLSGDASQQHVSFRDSKLTRILQNALGGNSKTAIICTITPAHIEESDSTLKFASRAKSIKTKAVVNEVMSDSAMLKRYRLKIKKLEQQINKMNDTDINLEKAELEKRLKEKEDAESQQADMIFKLQAMIVTSGSGHIGQEPPKKRRRETWCPGKAKRELNAISEISPPKLHDFRDKSLPFTTRMQDNTVFEEEDSFQLLENIMSSGVKDDSTKNQASPDPNQTINTDSTIKQLFELQDKHELVLEELKKKDDELRELQEFTSLEREMEADQIKQIKEDLQKLTEDNTAMRENVTWLEEELMKAHKERNGLRQTVETTHAKLNAAEDGTGLTQKSKQLTASEAKVSDLNTDMETQKAQYEFHLEQMKKKLEIYTLMLEERGVDYNSIKARLSVNETELEEPEQINTGKSDEITELKNKHEQELNDLRNEIDMLVLAVEKEKQQNTEAQERFEQVFEDQKAQFRKDIDETKEEIEIYQQMLEEEKAKRMNLVQNSEMIDNETRLLELKSEFESQKQTYEKEIARLGCELELKNQPEIGKEIGLEVPVNGIIVDKAVHDENLNRIKTEYESQIAEYETKLAELKEKLEGEKVIETEKENEYEKQITDLTAAYETRETELKEQLSRFSDRVTSKTDSKECQTEKIQRHVNFDIGSEIENQKERYESLIKDLTEERDAFLSVLEEKSVNESQGNDHLKVYKEQILYLKSEVQKYKKLNENKTELIDIANIDQVSEMETETNNIQELKKDFEEQMNELKIEAVKYKELYESEKVRMRRSQGSSFTFDESVCINDENLMASEQSSCAMDLQKEMLQAEINKLKENHETEVEELKEEISNYVRMIENKATPQMSLEVSQNNLHESTVNEETADEVKIKFENEIQDLKSKIQELTDNLEIEKCRNNFADGEVVDIKSEMHRAESEEAEVRHLEEIQELRSKSEPSQQLEINIDVEDIEAKDMEILELKEKLNTYEEMLHKEKDKLEQILQAVDERRSEFEKHESMKSMYEGKIKELNEDIKIYMDLLEEGKCQSSGDQMAEKDPEDCETKFIEEIDRLKIELEKFTNLYEIEKEKNENSRENTTEQNNEFVLLDNEKLKAHIEELGENHKKEIEFMKEEFAKFAAEHLQKKGDERENDVEEIENSYEKEIECLKIELQELKEKTEQRGVIESESECFDLKSEMLKAELDLLKESHRSEIESLQSELKEVKELQHTNDQKEIPILADDLRIRYDTEISQLKEKLQTYSVNSLETTTNNTADTRLDIQTEMQSEKIETIKESFVEEIKVLKECHAEEIARLQKEIQSVGTKETSDASLNTSELQGEDSLPDTDEVKQLRVDVQNLQICLEKERKKISQQEEDIESARKQHEVYETTIEEMQDVVGNMTTQLQQLRQDLGVLEAAKDRLKQEKLDLINARERFSQLSDEQEGTIYELRDALKELQDNIKHTEDENKHLKSRVEQLEQHIAMGKGMLASKDEEIKKLVDEIEEHRENLETGLHDKVKEMKEYANELEVKVSENGELLQQANEKIMELEQCEVQFSDKLLSLESDVELYKEKEEALSKVCTEYEEKIVHLETEIETVKVKNMDLENTCSEQEKKIEGLTEHLELAQNKDIELKEIQCRYQDKITELENELKQSSNRVKETESQIRELQSKCESLSNEIDTLQEELKKELEKNSDLEKEKEEATMNLEQQLEKSKEKLHEMEEKLDIYAETVKELQEEIKLNDEESELLRSRVTDLETDSKVTRETLSENDILKVKLESLESELTEKLEHVASCETEIETLKDKLALAENTSLRQEEVDRLKAEFVDKVKAAEEKVKVIELERGELHNMTESLQREKEEIEKRVKDLEEVKMSLEEDNLQLEKGLHPIAVKYHSLPENIDWETKWNEFTREEKKKRLAVYATVRALKKEVQKEQDRQKNAYEEALEAVYEKEQNTEVYKKLEGQIKSVSDEANTLYYNLEEEKKVTKELREKIADLERNGHNSRTTNVDFMTEDHPCKYKLEAFSASEKLQTAQEEHIKRIAQYEETVQQYDARIARMKNEMRRIQTDMDTTFDGRSAKMPKLSMEPKCEQLMPETPSSTPSTTENVSYGGSMSGIVDHFKVCITEAENKRLKQEIDKQKKKMSRVDDVERENTKVKEELQNMRKKYFRIEEIEKENVQLKEELKKATAKGKDPQKDTSLNNSSFSRHPLGDMFVTASESRSDSMAVPPSPKKEPRYKVPDLNPTKKREDKLIKECQDEVNNCKTT